MIFSASTTTEEAKSFAEAAVRELCELQTLVLKFDTDFRDWLEIEQALGKGLPAVALLAGKKNLSAVRNLAAVRGATDIDKLAAIQEQASGAKLLATRRAERIARTIRQFYNALKGAGLPDPILVDNFSLPVDQVKWDDLQRRLEEIFSVNPELPGRLFENAGWPLPLANWAEVRAAEVKEINDLRIKRGLEREKEQDDDWFGLAFSGGGIRSATFNLGILQGLACFGLLRKVDILSTVSGGGYIGSWLAAWIKREKIDVVEKELAASGAPTRDSPTPGPVRFLRQFSNYLTPTLGFFSLDSWTVAAVYIRNVALNQVTLAALIGALMMLPRFAVWPLMRSSGASHTWAHNWMIQLGIALSTASVIWIGLNLLRVTADAPKPQDEKRNKLRGRWRLMFDTASSLGNLGVQFTCAALMITAVGFASGWFWLNMANQQLQSIENNFFWQCAAVVFFFLSLSITVCCRSFGCVNERMKGVAQKFSWLALVVAMLTSTGVAMALLRGYLAILSSFHALPDSGKWHAVIWSPPMLMMVPGTAAILHIGLLGTYVKDVGREWLTRFRAITHLWLTFWAALCCAEIYGPLLFAEIGVWLSGAVSLAWIVSTVTALKAGQSALTGHSKDGKPGASPLDLLSKIGPPIFAVGFLLFLSLAEHLYLSYPKASPLNFNRLLINHWQWLNPEPIWPQPGLEHPFFTPGALFLILSVSGLILAWRIDINEFSMHHFYKNRLVRCYLGASNLNRDANPFTGFDPGDDFSLCSLKAEKGYTGPYHIVNTTLNLSAGGDLAWQERKGASFIFTPAYCGFDLSQETGTERSKREEAKLTTRAYRDTRRYGYPEGVPLGTAVAISGAAADPNQGYSTSPTVAFLMTVFDVRLGWWLGNPRRNVESTLSGPRFGLISLLSELLGHTDDKTNFVSLSDGGHFENMALYELVRRRCRYIILCDGEQDEGFQFQGLGTAIRKCRIDFGAQIDIDPRAIIPKGDPKRSEAHCAVGTIRYADKSVGTLLYIKSSLTGDEPKDVLQYSASSPTFPHETTADQWFSESQFESYRALGYAAVNAAIEPAKIWAGAKGTENVKALFEGLCSCWYPPNPGLQENAIKHTATLSQLFTRIASDKNLHDLGHKLFAVNGEFAPGGARKPDEFYFVMVLLQLVEDIYFDFQLQKSDWREDPRIRGWMKLFEGWAHSDIVKEVWKAKHDTFRQDFQNFWETMSRSKSIAKGQPSREEPTEERYVSKQAGA